MITTEEKQMALAGHDLLVRANSAARVLTQARSEINSAALAARPAIHHPDADLAEKVLEQLDALYAVFKTLGEIQRAMETRPDDAPPSPGSNIRWLNIPGPVE